MRKLLFFLFMLVLSLPGQGKDIRILAIGNSFSGGRYRTVSI